MWARPQMLFSIAVACGTSRHCGEERTQSQSCSRVGTTANRASGWGKGLRTFKLHLCPPCPWEIGCWELRWGALPKELICIQQRAIENEGGFHQFSVWVSSVTYLIQKINATCKATQSIQRDENQLPQNESRHIRWGTDQTGLLPPPEKSAAPLTTSRPSWGHLGPELILHGHRAALRTHPWHLQPDQKRFLFISDGKLSPVESRRGLGNVSIRLHTLTMAKKKAHWALWLQSSMGSWSFLISCLSTCPLPFRLQQSRLAKHWPPGFTPAWRERDITRHQCCSTVPKQPPSSAFLSYTWHQTAANPAIWLDHARVAWHGMGVKCVHNTTSPGNMS